MYIAAVCGFSPGRLRLYTAAADHGAAALADAVGVCTGTTLGGTVYVGRIAAVGMSRVGRLVVMYRVSSRSYPNRTIRAAGLTMTVVPSKGFESDIHSNPYIAYNCLRIVGTYAVAANGTHTDPISEKLETGMRMRDAMVSALSGLDFEHDEHGTPRISAAADRRTRVCALGIVRRDALLVREFELAPGEALYIATYEHNEPSREYRDSEFDVASADEACDYVIGQGAFASLEHPIAAASAFEEDQGFTLASREASDSGLERSPTSSSNRRGPLERL